ncbi:MAG TPA: hypothetical protein VHY20_08565, partial [Pirellulales bacterium]|nr:hypothetical protein [Pirellulales bacterium]
DSTGNDALFAAGDQFQLAYPGLTLNIVANKAYTINAKSQNGGTDTATVRQIDYALHTTGNWLYQ